MKTQIDLSPSVLAAPLSEEASVPTAPSLRQRTETAFRQSSDDLQELLDTLPAQAKKDARHHLRVQQIAFEVHNEELRQILAAQTIDGHFALCICGGVCTALPS